MFRRASSTIARRASAPRVHALQAAAVAAMLALATGCSGLGATLLTTSAGAVAGAGVNYSLNGIAYKTFTAPSEEVYTATRHTVERMQLRLQEDRATDEGYELVANASDRVITVEIERITGVVSRVRVGVDQDGIFKDRATATEIIVQVAETVEYNMRIRRAQARARN